MDTSHKNQAVDHACLTLTNQMCQEVSALYQDIGRQSAAQMPEVRPSFLMTQEKIRLSKYVNLLLQQIKDTFRQTLSQNDVGYTSSEAALMWQSVSGDVQPPKLSYLQREMIPCQPSTGSPAAAPSASDLPVLPILAGIGGLVLFCAAGPLFSVEGAATVGTYLCQGVSLCGIGYGVYGSVSAMRKRRPDDRPHPPRETSGDAFPDLLEKQCHTNTNILRRWIREIGEMIKESEPIL